ncbi:MAG: 4a-hydroxytetrahydrobiopterin dehydratase [Candidatus Nanohaloarchaea archaeon]
MEKMDDDEIEDARRDLEDGWEVVDGHHLQKKFEFEDFQGALEFVNQVGEIAEEKMHHPEIEFTWGEATVRIHTHEADGLTSDDFGLAEEIDGLEGGR